MSAIVRGGEKGAFDSSLQALTWEKETSVVPRLPDYTNGEEERAFGQTGIVLYKEMEAERFLVSYK